MVAQVSGVCARAAGDEPWPAMQRRGVFVTLRKAGRLRGCIGTFAPRADLPETVVEMAVAATRDPRFTAMPISSAEAKDIRIELSILSPLRRIEDPLDFELGRHGIHLRHGIAAGCFLPDVGTEQGWDKETFLSELCRQKAGLRPDAWRDPAVEIQVFTVQKFAERP
jgi:AmmeMemoRadiSam system protein A